MPPWPGPPGADGGGHEVGADAGGDEGLGAVDDVVVAVALRTRVVMRATSEPPPGSVMASDPISVAGQRRPDEAVDEVGVAAGGDVRQRDAGR